jgi:hypothetical protein
MDTFEIHFLLLELGCFRPIVPTPIEKHHFASDWNVRHGLHRWQAIAEQAAQASLATLHHFSAAWRAT